MVSVSLTLAIFSRAHADHKNDIPRPPSSSSVDCVICGDTRVVGSRIRVGRNTFVSLCGDTVIDLRETAMSTTHSNEFYFIVVRLCGDVRLWVPRGTQVTVRRFSLCGEWHVDVDEDNDAEAAATAPTVKLTLVMLCGNVRVEN